MIPKKREKKNQPYLLKKINNIIVLENKYQNNKEKKNLLFLPTLYRENKKYM